MINNDELKIKLEALRKELQKGLPGYLGSAGFMD